MDTQGSLDEWTERLNERSRRMGSNIDLAELFYTGERNSAGDYLTSKAWGVTIRSTREAYAVNGFEFPEDVAHRPRGQIGLSIGNPKVGDMARTEGDSWDLASSVGATATMVAAQRALSSREGLIDDPFAEPLVRAVGLDFFIRALDGEIELEDVDPEYNMRHAAEGMEVDPLVRQVVHRRGGRRGSSGGDPRVRSGRPGVPAALARRHNRVRARSARGHRVQEQDAGRSGCAANGRPAHRRDRSSRRLAEGATGQRLRPISGDSMDAEGCSSTCRPRPRICCSTGSTS